MSFWFNFFNLIFVIIFIHILNNNKSLLTFILWAEILWIILFVLTIIYASWNNPLILINSFYILICTAVEISLLTLIFLSYFLKK